MHVCKLLTGICFPVLNTVIQADSFEKPSSYLLVAGSANFKMPSTCLTLCGMTQPATAVPLIVDKSNVDKGLASRFLCIFPNTSVQAIFCLRSIYK